jgi:hypothetical protein
MEAVESRLLELEEKVNALARAETVTVAITSFCPEPFVLRKEIKAVIEESDGEYIASFYDANVSAGGCNQAEAYENLKDVLLSRFDYLDRLPPEKLGPGPSRQLAVLREFIQRSALADGADHHEGTRAEDRQEAEGHPN